MGINPGHTEGLQKTDAFQSVLGEDGKQNQPPTNYFGTTTQSLGGEKKPNKTNLFLN